MDLERKQVISLGEDCYLDIEREILVKDNLSIVLSRAQFCLLHCLAQNMGQPVSKQNLISFVWETKTFAIKNHLYVCINQLRKKLEDKPQKPKCLLTLRGVGYILVPRDKRSN